MSKSRGQELVEFALVLPLMLLIILGALATANAVSSSTQVNQAAARAALDAANTSTANCSDAFSSAQAAVREIVTSNLITVTQLSVDCNVKNNGGGSHDICTGTLTTADACTATHDIGDLLSVKVNAQVSFALFGTGPNLGISAIGASIIPRSP